MKKRGNGDSLTLGVKGRLSNQEMEMLRTKLAEAVAYDHVPDAKRADRQAKSTHAAKPMTKLYRKIDGSDPADHHNASIHRPGRKTLASMQYEKQFVERSYDSLKIVPKKGISSAAKTLLQDEYMTKPRDVSSIPVNLMTEGRSPEGSSDSNQSAGKSGKRLGPAPIPQIFIL